MEGYTQVQAVFCICDCPLCLIVYDANDVACKISSVEEGVSTMQCNVFFARTDGTELAMLSMLSDAWDRGVVS